MQRRKHQKRRVCDRAIFGDRIRPECVNCPVGGIATDSAGRLTATGCRIESTGEYGVFVGAETTVAVQGLDIDGCESGIRIAGGRSINANATESDTATSLNNAAAEFCNVTICGTDIGIEAGGRHFPVSLTDASIDGPRRHGIRLDDDIRLIAQRCTISNAHDLAITLTGDSQLTISDSRVIGSS